MSKFAKLIYLEPEKVQVLFYMDSENAVPGMRCLTQLRGQRIEVFYAAHDEQELRKLWHIIKRMDDDGAREFLRAAAETVEEEEEEEVAAAPGGRLH